MFDYSFALQSLTDNRSFVRRNIWVENTFITLVSDWNGCIAKNLPPNWKGNKSFIAYFNEEGYLVPYNVTLEDMMAKDWDIVYFV
jgi:hypothetical protein